MRVLAMATIALAVGASFPRVALAAMLNGGATRVLASANERAERVQYRGSRYRQQGTTVHEQIARDRRNQHEQYWRLRRDQTRGLEIQQDVTVNKALNGERARRAWQRYIND